MNIKAEVSQSSILVPLLVSLDISDVANNVAKADLHVHADDTQLFFCCLFLSPAEAISDLQRWFETVEQNLNNQKLVLNDTKEME